MLLVHIGAIPRCNYSICTFSKSVFSTINLFHKFLSYFFMFQCNEHVEINKLLCSLASTWITTLHIQFYIFDSLSLDVLLE